MCSASAGVLKVLQREGIEVSQAVGSSAGSIYAALLALGESPVQLAEKSRRLWTSDLFLGYASNLRTVLSGETRFDEQSGLIDDSLINQRLEEIFGEYSFANTRLPLSIVSTDLYNGESVTLTEGSLRDAVRASISIPLIFAPWKIGEQWMVDGAVSNPLPVDVAIKNNAEIILAMGFELPTRQRMRSYTAVTTHFNSVYMNNILKSRFAFFNAVHHAEIIPIMPAFKRSIGTFDVEQIPYIIEEGERAAEEQIPYLQRLLKEV
jgi:NTE family protein